MVTLMLLVIVVPPFLFSSSFYRLLSKPLHCLDSHMLASDRVEISREPAGISPLPQQHP